MSDHVETEVVVLFLPFPLLSLLVHHSTVSFPYLRRNGTFDSGNSLSGVLGF